MSTCRCKTLSDTADGYARAEAVSALILCEPGSAALDGTLSGPALQVPLCLVRGSAAGQDGRSSALTAPNGPAQQEVLRAALSTAGLLAADLAVLQASFLPMIYCVAVPSVENLGIAYHRRHQYEKQNRFRTLPVSDAFASFLSLIS